VGGAGGCAGENQSIVAKLTDVEAERDSGRSRLFKWRPSAAAAQKGNGIGGAARRPLAPLLEETLGASSRLRKRWCPRRSCSALGSGGHGWSAAGWHSAATAATGRDRGGGGTGCDWAASLSLRGLEAIRTCMGGTRQQGLHVADGRNSSHGRGWCACGAVGLVRSASGSA
jgi:hypothetical protein